VLIPAGRPNWPEPRGPRADQRREDAIRRILLQRQIETAAQPLIYRPPAGLIDDARYATSSRGEKRAGVATAVLAKKIGIDDMVLSFALRAGTSCRAPIRHIAKENMNRV